MFHENKMPATAAMPVSSTSVKADAVRREVIMNAQRRDPRILSNGYELATLLLDQSTPAR